MHAIFVYSLATRASTQITDSMSSAAHPVFDASGKYLYFAASTNNGPSDAGIDLWRARSRHGQHLCGGAVHIGASPVPPESDDENKKKDDEDKKDDGKKDESKKDESKKDDAKKKAEEKPKPTVIDLAGIGNRILSLPIPARNYVDLSVGKSVLFLAAGAAVGRRSRGQSQRLLSAFLPEAPDRRDVERRDRLQGLLRR